MAGKRIIGWAGAAIIAGLVAPLAAQQQPAPGAPAAPAQPAPGAAQPADPNNPPILRQPVIPRRVPAPALQQSLPSPPQQPGAPNAPAPAAPPAQEAGEAAAPAAPPTPPTPQRRFGAAPGIPSGGMISLNFNRADLIEIIHIIAQQLHLTYTIDPDVKGTVTINSAEPLRAEDLLPIFHQILRMNGAVAVRTGNLYHIMPIKDGKGLARPAGQSREDSFALQVLPVRFFSVAEMKRVLTPFLQPGGEIVENPRGNFLIVMDLPSNIQRLAEIAEMIDVQVFAGTRMEIYQPKVASAEELSQEMTKVMQSFSSSAPQAENFAAEFIPLPRINQLLVISHSEAAWTYAKRWLDRIDVVAEGPGRRIFIYPVENGKATELADVLSQALGQPASGRRDSTRTLQDLHRSTTSSGLGNMTGRSTPGSSFGSSGSSGSFGQSQPLGAYAAVPAPAAPGSSVPVPVAPPPAPGAARPPAPGAQSQQPPPEQLRIVPDPATNSLIIYGTAQEFQNIKNILKDLDAVPRQVLIDALILQVDLKNGETFGVDYEILRNFGDVKIFDKTFNSRGQIITGALAAFAKGGGVSGVIGTGDTVRAFVTALMTDSRVKILSSPSVLASDNRPARIQVGAEVPVPTGTITASTGAIGSSTTIEYRNTGRILTIIPQVNAQGLVNLQIKAEVSALGDNIAVGGNGETFPTFNTQDAETTAVVLDGETLVIGGLIGENKTRTRSGVPYLMDLPIVGRFFGTTSDDTSRTELIMLITPHVIRNRTEARYVTEEFKTRLNTVRNELERMARERAQSRPPAPPAQPAPPAESPAAPESPARPPAGSAPPPGPGAALSPFGPGAPAFARDTVLWANVDRPDPTAAAREAAAPAEPGPNPAAIAAPNAAARPVYRAASRLAVPLQRKPERCWTVRVAALADQREACTVMQALCRSGFDAYVTTIQAPSKI